MYLGYIRVSTDHQDNSKQKHLILEYAQEHGFIIDEFIEVQLSTKKSEKERKIELLKEKLKENDTLIVAELSRLGRNMIEVMNLIQELNDRGVKFIFLRQPELSTFNNAHSKLLLAIYSYFAESEREFISMRTKQGLAVARASGKKIGRQKGALVRSKFDVIKEEIRELLKKDISIRSVHKLLGVGSYVGIREFILRNQDLEDIVLENQRIKKRSAPILKHLL